MTVFNMDFKESNYKIDVSEYTALCEDMKSEKNIRAVYLWEGCAYYRNPYWILPRIFPELISERLNVQVYDPLLINMDQWNFNVRRDKQSIYQFAIKEGYQDPNSWECRKAFIKEAKVNYLFLSESDDKKEVDQNLPIVRKWYLPVQGAYVYKIWNIE